MQETTFTLLEICTIFDIPFAVTGGVVIIHKDNGLAVSAKPTAKEILLGIIEDTVRERGFVAGRKHQAQLIRSALDYD